MHYNSSSVCGIAYKNVTSGTPQWSTRGFYSNNKFVKRDTNCQNGLKTRFYRLF